MFGFLLWVVVTWVCSLCDNSLGLPSILFKDTSKSSWKIELRDKVYLGAQTFGMHTASGSSKSLGKILWTKLCTDFKSWGTKINLFYSFIFFHDLCKISSYFNKKLISNSPVVIRLSSSLGRSHTLLECKLKSWKLLSI